MPAGKVFLDTNILIYAVSKRDTRQAKAYSLIENGACVSTQVLAEFSNVCLRKNLLSVKEIATFLDEFTSTLSVSAVKLDTLKHALSIMQRYRFHFYDALVVSSALEAKASVLYTEDMQHKQKIESLSIINPFV